jgi:hypothetical protein
VTNVALFCGTKRQVMDSVGMNKHGLAKKKYIYIFIVYTTPKVFYFSEQRRRMLFLKEHKMFKYQTLFKK